MKIMRYVALLLLPICAWQTLRAALPAHSVSPSRQFVIYGADAALRGTISELAEQTKANLLALLRQRDGWKTAIIINLQPQQANLPEIPPADLRVSQTGFGVKLQLDLTVGQNLDGSLIERQLLRAILLEMIYRHEGNLAPGTFLVGPPDWLVRDFNPGAFNNRQEKVAGGISRPAIRSPRFRRTHALPSLFRRVCAIAPG
ncbi:MAG: hypothetical protein DME48_04540 [Verrucomicrobia bacterium]|nr:MAG: hypothetical protein DME48_04540 [Verrucomicrobiota bacterium]